MRLILASASQGRLGVLRGAGIDPVVRVSGVDEDALTARLAGAAPAELVTALACAKASAVAAEIGSRYPDAVIVGCDSMLHIDGELVGKPGRPETATRCWRAMAGRRGELLTGHAVIRLDRGERTAAASGAHTTVIHFGTPSPEELEAYVRTGEPLHVAGGFTLDGRGGWFVDGIEGDPSSVIGISLPLTRRLLAEVGVPVVSLWS
ncbi:MAG TPA: nucleoside triphosphate pyrophosphatase [Pseudonocardiaceae bacterium]|nr:nucleoside triphosphate pyrophosphatase [Pseudonocardiaceae bacterium]